MIHVDTGLLKRICYWKIAFMISMSFIFWMDAQAQHTFKALIKEKSTLEPLTGATATAASAHAVSDTNGHITLRNLPTGKIKISFSFIGHKNIDSVFELPDTSLHTILMEQNAKALGDVIVIASTRGEDLIENSPTKVEVLSQDDMNEENNVKPGNIASILGDVSGIQIQQSSVTSGNVNVRMQGLDGRYTQILRDGMPLYEGYSGGFGVLSIPPLDLKQIELIKGSSSTLYGGGAIAGLINLISRRPSEDPGLTFMVNRSTLKETNANGYYAQRWKKIGVTLLAQQTFQQEVDVNHDGLSDVPNIKSTLIHPTLFIYPAENTSISLSWSGNFEKRLGGDMMVIDGHSDSVHQYFEENKLNRNTFTVIEQTRFNHNLNLTVKGSLSVFDRKEQTNTYNFHGKQNSYYTEISIYKKLHAHGFTAGINFTGDRFAPSSETPAPVGILSNNTVGVFIQDSWQLLPTTKLETGIRFDHHNSYGNFVLPRIALFHRFNEHWGSRLGFGFGYSTPNPLSPQLKDYTIYQINPIGPNVVAEKSYGGNIDFNYKIEIGSEGSFFINQSFFLTNIDHPLVGAEDNAGNLNFSNKSKPVVTKGSDTYILLNFPGWEFYFGYTYTDALRKYLDKNQFMPVTPRNRFAATAVYEVATWRFGIEASYNGYQYREDETKTPSYWFMAAMISKKIGPKWTLVLNGENLFDERQSRYESLYTGNISHPVFKTLWAPIDGRVINLSLQFQPFAKKE